MEFLTVFCMSIMPITYLEEGMELGAALRLSMWAAYAAAVLGNVFPIPFLWVLLKELSNFIKRADGRINKSIAKYREPLLLVLTSIPLPLPVSWVGVILAILLDIPAKRALLIILLGTAIAGLVIVSKRFMFM